ncbi:secretion-regulating guanine nucleotide exchange factor isoform X3 [Amia ocellicauda]|uniref:secretion-regulating guanine nucleotide exchange factor isoform X3 n=1 Tax=Amia ocellicauda TaxID=2972642 RepID=UPI003463ECD8
MEAGEPACGPQCLFTWGANSYGQLGRGGQQDQSEPGAVAGEEAAAPRGLVGAVGGGGHSALLTAAGELWVCGQNHRGQLGLGHTSDVLTFQLCPGPAGRVVRQVACGWDFTLLLMEGGVVYSCGSNVFGQLGVPGLPGHGTQPRHVQSLCEEVTGVAAGLRHSMAVTGSGRVYQWGTGLASEARRALHPDPVPAHLSAKEPSVVPGLEHVTAVAVAAGSSHCVCLAAGGAVLLWGSNRHGQLGAPLAGPFLSRPRSLDRATLGGGAVVAVWSGWTHLVAKTESGRVFTWGRADYGQLGRPTTANGSPGPGSHDVPGELRHRSAETAVEVKGLSAATQIACGSEHSLAIVGEQLLSWGWNEHGMCGDGTEEDVIRPQPIPALLRARPLLIGCGAGHSMALCEVREEVTGKP